MEWSQSLSVLSDWDPMDYSPPGSTILGFLQAKLLEWVAMPSRSSSQCRDQTHVPWSSCIAGELFTAEPLGKSIWMWELDIKEGWMMKNWRFWSVLPEKTLESPLDYKEIKSVNLKGNQPWILIERTDVEAEAPILWPPEAKSRLAGKDPDAKKDWRQKGIKEYEIVGWHQWLNGHEFEQTSGEGEGQERLVCVSL